MYKTDCYPAPPLLQEVQQPCPGVATGSTPTKVRPPVPEQGLPGKGLLRLCVVLATLMLIMYVFTPALVKRFDPIRKYASVVHETGITPGALFYSDVPQTMDAEMHNRDSIRYFLGSNKE